MEALQWKPDALKAAEFYGFGLLPTIAIHGRSTKIDKLKIFGVSH